MAIGYPLLLIAAQTDGTAITNSTTQASIIPAAAKYTMQSNFLDGIGKQLRIKAAGRLSCVVTTPGTLTLEFRMGATSTVVAAASSAMAMNIVAKTNVTWILEWTLLLRAIGTTGNFMHIGVMSSEAVVGAAAGSQNSWGIPLSAPAVGASVDTTIANVCDLQAKFSVATATTAIQLHQYELWADNWTPT